MSEFQPSRTVPALKDLTLDQLNYINLYPIYYGKEIWSRLIEGVQLKAEVPVSEDQAIFWIKFLILRDWVRYGIPSPEEAPKALEDLKAQLAREPSNKRRRQLSPPPKPP